MNHSLSPCRRQNSLHPPAKPSPSTDPSLHPSPLPSHFYYHTQSRQSRCMRILQRHFMATSKSVPNPSTRSRHHLFSLSIISSAPRVHVTMHQLRNAVSTTARHSARRGGVPVGRNRGRLQQRVFGMRSWHRSRSWASDRRLRLRIDRLLSTLRSLDGMARRSRSQEDLVNAEGDQEKKTEALPELLAALDVCSLVLTACCVCLCQLLLEGANALQQL